MRYLIIILLFWTTTLAGQDPLFVDITQQGIVSSNNNGIVIGDFDNDGFEDIFVPSRLDDNSLLKNMGDGTFTNVTSSSGIELDGLTMTGSWGDIDNDGDLDLFVGNYYTATSSFTNYLYLNDGNGVFTDISASAGINTNDQTRSVHMVDIDLDGYLDIYVCNLLQQNTLWKNNGDNTFTDHTFVSGLFDSMISMGAVFFDYDNDGDQDVYLTHDGNQANIMYENNGLGFFTNVSFSSQLNVVGQGMGVDHGDINNDGHLDVYVTNLGPNFLLLNNGNGVFSEIAVAAGAADETGMGWGCFFVDYDNDGWEDIYVINDSGFSPSSNKLYKNNGNNTFTLVTDFSSPLFSFFDGRGGTWADFNHDGFPEIVVANGQSNVGVQVFENQNSINNWIGFELEGTSVTRNAYGTRIQVTTMNGVKIDEKTCGSSYASQSSHRIYFGLGQGQVSDILITWPDGSLDFFDSLAINQIHSIQQGMSPPADLDGDGFPGGVDCDDMNVNVNPNATEIPYNGLDDDCDPLTLDDDLDGDGFLLVDDCDDMNSAINPVIPEIPYNGIDDDCDPLTLDDDLDGDGFVLADDCDDTNDAVNSGMTEIVYNGIDDDCDPLTLDDDLDGDGFVLADDCDDTNDAVNSGMTEIVYNGIDDDCDPLTLDDDLDGDGFVLADDCDDTNDAVNSGMTEIVYNGIDDDCDPLTLDDDLDGDGFVLADDCDDMNDAINSGMTEIVYNGIDDDCDPLTLDDDLDGDGFVLADDCDDTNDAVNSGMTEIVYNGIDDDCDPLTLDDDLDGDGFVLADDCDDTNDMINSGMMEIVYNGIDDDCDPLTLDDDLDGDGFVLADDCDDTNDMINSGMMEIVYNGIDDDCDLLTLDDDLDGDGFVLANDCDDMNDEINPNATEIPNNQIDEDCDGEDLMTSTHELANSIINIFPNPTSDFLYLEIPEILNFEVKIYDLTGRMLFSKINKRTLNLGNYNSGIYLIEIRDLKSNQKVVERIVVE